METTRVNLIQQDAKQVQFDCWFASKHIQVIIPIQEKFITREIFNDLKSDIEKLFKIPKPVIKQKFDEMVIVNDPLICEDLIYNSYQFGLGILYSFFIEKSNFLCTNFVKVFFPKSKNNTTISYFVLDFDNNQMQVSCPFFKQKINFKY